MALGIAEAITEVAKLLSKAFGFAVDPDGFARLSRESQLKTIARGMDIAISKNDWATVDALFGQLDRLCRDVT
jgi:hypothetical protein